ncbi:MAG: glycosyltransferase [Acidimicrobiales bacterium]
MRRRVQVALICVTHDSESLLPGFAEAARQGLSGCDARIVVADSASTDHTLAVVAELLPEADICRLDGNRGYAAGFNAGVRLVRSSGGAENFLLSNPDMRLHPDTVPTLLARLSDGVGVAVPQLRDQRHRLFHSLRHPPSALATWCEAFLGGPLAGRLGLPCDVVWDSDRYLADAEPAWATGGLVAISEACLDLVGPWDESYFLYEEEVDFMLRVADAGMRVLYVADAVATRLLEEGRVAPWAYALMRSNRARLLRRRLPASRAAAQLSGLLVGDGLRALRGRPEARAALWAVSTGARPQQVMARYGVSTGSSVDGPATPGGQGILATGHTDQFEPRS